MGGETTPFVIAVFQRVASMSKIGFSLTVPIGIAISHD
jgi:hypothetical protein